MQLAAGLVDANIVFPRNDGGGYPQTALTGDLQVWRHDSSGDFIEPTQFAATGLEPPMTIAVGVHHARVAKQRCRPAMSHPAHRSDV